MVGYKVRYLNCFGLSEGDFVACECCEAEAVEVHHIFRKGMGGSKEWDFIENLMAVCRSCHAKYGDITELRKPLIDIHVLRMQAAGIQVNHLNCVDVINGVRKNK